MHVGEGFVEMVMLEFHSKLFIQTPCMWAAEKAPPAPSTAAGYGGGRCC